MLFPSKQQNSHKGHAACCGLFLCIVLLFQNNTSFAAAEYTKTQKDSVQAEKKEARIEMTKKVFKYISYISYNDRGYGKDFSGVEKYQQYEGKKISCIDIVVFKPFGCTEDSCPTQVSKGQKFGNAIHFKSREWYIKGDIFFKEGDLVNPTLFADSERQLWDRKKFKDVKIMIMPDSLNTDNVEVMVFLQDKLSWTAAVGYSNNRLLFMLSTYNFFGLPNTLNLFTGLNFNKYNIWAFGGQYRYENIQSSQINLTTTFITEELNKNVLLAINRKFFNLNTKWAFDLQYEYDNSTISLTGNLRDPSSFVKSRSDRYSLWLAHAFPASRVLPVKDENLKMIVGIKANYTEYKKRPFIVNKFYNESFIQQQNYNIGIGLSRWGYYLERDAFYIDMAEYFPRGLSTSLWVGPQIDEQYGRRTSLDFNINYGIYLKHFGYLLPQINYSTFVKNRKGEQMLTRFNLDYVSKKLAFAKHMYFRQILRGGANLGYFIPEERYFNINETRGIRGFYSPTLKGSKSITLSAECDLFLDKKILMSKGMLYTFCDMGWMTENGTRLFRKSKYQYGIGVGMRFRSVDLGFPYIDFQFGFYPRGKDFGAQIFQFKLYDQNINAITPNNMFISPTAL